MPAPTFVSNTRARASDMQALVALCVLTDTARTVTVGHTWSASQTFNAGFTGGASADIAINTNKFTVLASSGNTVVGGTLVVASNITQSAGTAALQAITGTTLVLSSTLAAGNAALVANAAVISTNSATGTSAHYWLMTNTTGSFLVGIEGSATTLLTGAPAYSGVINVAANKGLYIGTNNTLAVTIAANGTVALASSLTITGALSGVTSMTFSTTATSTTAFATPGAISATQFSAFASAVNGAAIMGFGTTYDVALKGRSGATIIGILSNTPTVKITGNLQITNDLILTGTSLANIVDLSMGGSLTLAGGLVTYGVADSGGAGKRQVLVPN